jgi:hypothetical protein
VVNEGLLLGRRSTSLGAHGTWLPPPTNQLFHYHIDDSHDGHDSHDGDDGAGLVSSIVLSSVLIGIWSWFVSRRACVQRRRRL